MFILCLRETRCNAQNLMNAVEMWTAGGMVGVTDYKSVDPARQLGMPPGKANPLPFFIWLGGEREIEYRIAGILFGVLLASVDTRLPFTRWWSSKLNQKESIVHNPPSTVSVNFDVQATPPFEQYTAELLSTLTTLYVFDRETFYDLVSTAISNAGELCRDQEDA